MDYTGSEAIPGALKLSPNIFMKIITAKLNILPMSPVDRECCPGFYIKNTTSPGVYDTPGAEGIYYYKVSAVDNIGNEGPASIAVYTSIVILKPIGKAFVYPKIIRNTANITMTYFGVKNKSTVYVNTSTFDSNGFVVYLNETNEDAVYNNTYIVSPTNNLPDGNYTVIFTINDSGSFIVNITV